MFISIRAPIRGEIVALSEVIRPEGLPKPKSAIGYNIVVPVLVYVNEQQAQRDVRLEILELIIPFTRDETDRPRMRLTAQNRGQTFCRMGASVKVIPELPGADLWEADEIHFEETWIMPGATVQLIADYRGPHPDQPLSIHGTLKRIEEHRFTRGLMGAEDRKIRR